MPTADAPRVTWVAWKPAHWEHVVQHTEAQDAVCTEKQALKAHVWTASSRRS